MVELQVKNEGEEEEEAEKEGCLVFIGGFYVLFLKVTLGREGANCAEQCS